jgi:hypothetical protein
MHFCVWFCIFQAVHDADLEQKFTFFTEEIWFQRVYMSVLKTIRIGAELIQHRY